MGRVYLEKRHASDFTDLVVWQVAHAFVLDIYSVTKLFPGDERFGLVSQMRRAAVSITSNIVEGYGRWGMGEKRQFYSIASGSLAEVQNQLLIAKDLGFLASEKAIVLEEASRRVYRLLNAFISSIK